MGFQESSQCLLSLYPPSFIPAHGVKQKRHDALRVRVVAVDRIKEYMDMDRVERGLKKAIAQYMNEEGKYLLVNDDTDQLLTCTGKGELKFDCRSSNQEQNKSLYRMATWSVFRSKSSKPKQNSLLTVYDEVCFKSQMGLYISCDNLGLCGAQNTSTDERTLWNLLRADTPVVPLWVYQRPAFSKFVSSNSLRQDPPFMAKERKPLKVQSPEVQQALLIEDILDLMLGFEGNYIKRGAKSDQLCIEPHLEAPSCTLALSQIVDRILAVPNHYYHIESFINTYSMQEGTVCQALCSGLRTIVKQYKMSVVQLDEQAAKELTLQRIWFFAQPCLKVLEALVQLIRLTQNKRGGQLISCVLRLLNENTDAQIVKIYKHLLEKVIGIYVRMISKWIYEGVIEDKHGEFMVASDPSAPDTKWEFWESKYFLRQEQVPVLFEKDCHKLLAAGKYINILRLCGRSVEHPYFRRIEENFQVQLHKRDFSAAINEAYEWANSQLQTLVYGEFQLLEVFRSIKGYFFLEYGDLFVHFMDAAQKQLSAPKSRIDPMRGGSSYISKEKLQSLFELMIRTSSANNDPFKDQVTCDIESFDLFEHIKIVKQFERIPAEEKPYLKQNPLVLDVFTLRYKCKFPLTLILNRNSLAKYQALFRMLFWAKFMERQLGSVWQVLQISKAYPIKALRATYQLLQRMVNFVKNLVYYLSYEVIEKNWVEFITSLQDKKHPTFQSIIEAHNSFLNRCLHQALLINNRLLTIIVVDIGTTCQQFFNVRATILKIYDKAQLDGNGEPSAAESKSLTLRRVKKRQVYQRLESEMENFRFGQLIETSACSFDEALKKLLKEIYMMVGKNQSHLVGLLDRLDPDNYYKRLWRFQ